MFTNLANLTEKSKDGHGKDSNHGIILAHPTRVPSSIQMSYTSISILSVRDRPT